MILLHKKSIVTIDVFYYLPEYTNILQEFVWQTEDIVPEYPRVHQFLNYWKENINAVISEVIVVDSDNYEYRPVKEIYTIQ
jgi:uncharacterized protein Usg|tara:strand:- start:148 stop:390 length:243 start_codon:yes stop_codon:yes gene_type:complete